MEVEVGMWSWAVDAWVCRCDDVCMCVTRYSAEFMSAIGSLHHWHTSALANTSASAAHHARPAPHARPHRQRATGRGQLNLGELDLAAATFRKLLERTSACLFWVPPFYRLSSMQAAQQSNTVQVSMHRPGYDAGSPTVQHRPG